ncbi:helix-turn-helix transcriptional regulator, partial [Ruminococcus difficilis]
MAEFGENIRRAREELGITQQTLADQLYVTRQAVSRWENGSRYPDLLTAKRLAASLDTTLDDLLADDDMHTYPEVNPVIEYPLYKRVQTALFSAAFMVNLV